MTTTRNGNSGNHPTRRLRFDASTSRLVTGPETRPTSNHSGRRLVTAAVLSILFLWGSLYLVFRDWRARFRERSAFGKSYVATAVDPLVHVVPAGVDPAEWRRAVSATHDMIVTLTGSNVLSLNEMKNLRGELAMRTARTRPETARDELTAIWKDLGNRAGPIVNRHKLPEILKDSLPKPKGPDGLPKKQ